ncbi:MAG: class I SAM-dependent methyltransferase [Anaerolineae bacterium]|nr:class I SAM-dependent methyltransferase [Anaerolineae bacterium]
MADHDQSDTTRWQDPNFLLQNQYQNAGNLSARNDLHVRFSTNAYGWRRWIFDQIGALTLPADAHVLELGAGPGWLWKDNAARAPKGWQVVISDASPGMVDAARNNLAETGLPARFEVVDIQRIPFDAASFDLVMAHHMLYHVPDLPAALAEVRRVLKPGGHFLAATNGEDHLRELRELMLHVGWPGMTTPTFNLENGGGILSPYFETVAVERYGDGLHITEAEPVVNYALSTIGATHADPDSVARFRALVERILSDEGALRVRKATGLFIARRE